MSALLLLLLFYSWRQFQVFECSGSPWTSVLKKGTVPPSESKKLENLAIANALQLEAAQATPALSRFNYDASQIEVSEPIHYRIIAFLLLIHYFTLWPWPLTFDLEHLYRITCDVMKLYQIWMQSSNLRRSYCDFSVWPYDLKHRFTCCARLWDNFHQVWPSTTYTCLNYFVFDVDTLCHAATLTFDLLTLKVRGTAIVCTKFEKSQAIPGWIIDNFAIFCICYFTLWLWPLTSWAWTSTALRVSRVWSMYNIWAQSNNPWLSYWRFSTFSRAILWGGTQMTELSQECRVRGPNFTKLGKGIGRSSQHCPFVSDFGYLAAHSKLNCIWRDIYSFDVFV